MKLMTVMFFLAITNLMASEAYSQTTKLTLQFEDVTVKEVLSKIEENSDFFFLYNSKLVDVDRKVSMDINEEKINEILSDLFRETDVFYTVVDRQVVLTNKANQNSFVDIGSQQTQKVTGTVTDENGNPLPGVNVQVEGTTIGAISDVNGKYSIDNPKENAVLIFSFIGYNTEKVTFTGESNVNIKLTPIVTGLDEVVVIGYGTQKKGNLTGSISSIKSVDIAKAPVASTTNALTGRLPGLISLQSSGQPGADAAMLSIRGYGDALIIVDGVQATFNTIDPNQIESISILKDGSASIYGSRAGNGVILVTTKRGNIDKPTITLNSSQTFQGITDAPYNCSAGQYAEMKSESWLNAGKPADQVPYTEDQIQKYYDGSDPLYPNTDWFNVLVRKWAPQQQHNLSIRGGSDKIRYYGFLGYLDQQTMFKENGGEYKRYNFQSNIDAKILENLALQINISSIVENKDFPNASYSAGPSSGVWGAFRTTLPIYPSSFPDPNKIPYAFGNGSGGAHILTNSALSGYNNIDNQNLNGTIALDYTFKSIKGLSVKALVNYLKNYSTVKSFVKPCEYYSYEPNSQIYTKVGATASAASLSSTKSDDYTLTEQLSVNYDNTFAKDHHFTALALFEAIDYYGENLRAGRINFMTSAIDQLFAGSSTGMTNYGSANEMGRKSFVGRLNYAFKNKYLIETTLRADASAKFPEDNRWGYFPSLSLGWVLSEENFLKNIPIINFLKLRSSYGQSGYDAVGNFQYLSGYKYGETILLGNGAQQGIISTGLANPSLTWEKITIYNVGLDFSLWKRRIYGEGDIFYRERSGIIATRITSLPSTFGATQPPENINSQNSRGFELSLGTSGSSNDFTWDLSGNISWSRSKWKHYEEPSYTDPVQADIYTISERWTDRQFGYLSDGLFKDQDEINALTFQYPTGNSVLRPGDIKYKNVNNDGVLDWKDQVEIGMGTTPHWMVGFNADLTYKNFDLSALFQGAFNYYCYVRLNPDMDLSPSIVYDMRWTAENNDPNAFIPRLTTPGGSVYNNYSSDHWYKKAGYLRLKTLAFGYNVPKKLIQKVKLTQMRIYFSGTNLLTFNKLKKFGIDPEAPSSNVVFYYPQQRTITFGINLSL